MEKQMLSVGSITVLLGVSSALGFLGYGTEMGLAVIAGSIGLAFSNIDKISRFKGAGFEAEMREKIIAVVDKEIEPEPDLIKSEYCIAGYEIDTQTKSVINALSSQKYTWRYLSGISKETGLTKAATLKILNDLVNSGFAIKSTGERGVIWGITNKGRNMQILMALEDKEKAN